LVPPLPIASVPPRVTGPNEAVDGVRPVDPPLNDWTVLLAGRLIKTSFAPVLKVTILPPLLDERIVVRARVAGAVNVPMPTSQLGPFCSAIV
jgi:hypothetical protein